MLNNEGKELLEAILEGKQIECFWESINSWKLTKDPLLDLSLGKRLRVQSPEVKRVAMFDYTFPLPEAVAPKDGTEYYVVYFTSPDKITSFVWSSHSLDRKLLSAGLVHLTREAAKEHAIALLKFNKLVVNSGRY